jgi:HAE1 family hydrophobic/amphiphilic exporter-1
MTFLATFLDLVPMAIGLDRHSETNIPLARAVVGGLLTSTVLTLIVVPILYTLFNKDGKSREGELEEHLAKSDFAAALGYRAPAAEPSHNGEVRVAAEV